MKKIEIAVALGLYGAAVNSGVGPSAYAEGSRCETDAIKISCPIQQSEPLHDHGEKDTDSGGALVSGTAAIVEGADVVRALGGQTVAFSLGTITATVTPAAS